MSQSNEEHDATTVSNDLNSGSPPSTLFVGDLSFFCDENDLRTLFSQHGKVVTTQLKRGKTGDSLMHGFVEMASQEEAEAARSSLMDTKYMGRKIRINWAYTAVVPRNRDGWVQVHVSFVTREMKEKINEEVLDSIFSAYGEVADITIKRYVRDTAGNVQSGYGFVFFLDSEAAAAAVKKIRKILIRGVTYDSSFSYRSEKELSLKPDSPTHSQSNKNNSPPDQRSQAFSHISSSPSVQYQEIPLVHQSFVPMHQQPAQQFFAPTYYTINQQPPPYFAIPSQQPSQANSNPGSHPNSPTRALHHFAPMGVSYVAVNSPSQYPFPMPQPGTNSPPELSLPIGNQYYQQYSPGGSMHMCSNYPGQSPNAPQMTYQLSSSPNMPQPPMVSIPGSHNVPGQNMPIPHHLSIPVPVMLPNSGVRADSPSTYSHSTYHPASNGPSPVAYMMTTSPHGVSIVHAPMQAPGGAAEYEKYVDRSSPKYNNGNNQVPSNRQNKFPPPPIMTTNFSYDNYNKSQYQPSPHYSRSYPSPKENNSQYARPPVGNKRGFDRSSPKSQDMNTASNGNHFAPKETGELKRPSSFTLQSSYSSTDDSIDRLTVGIGAMGQSDSSSSSPLHHGIPSVAAVSD